MPGTPNTLRRANRARVLRLVRRHGPISRAEIAERSGLSRAALTAIAQDLLDEGVLVEGSRTRTRIGAGAPSATPDGLGAAAPAGARRSGVGLSFNPAYALAVGVELTAGTLRGVVVDLGGQVRAGAERVFSSNAEPAAVVALAAALVDELATGRPIGGVGIAVSGQADPATGVSVSIPGMARWHSVALRDELERLTGLPALLDWRVNAAALAEQWHGIARDADDWVFVNVSDGVGMGLVLDDRIQRGWRSLAGGLGHIQVAAPSTETRICVCGNTGCLQTLVSVPAIVQRVRRSLDEGVHSVLAAPYRSSAALTFDHVVAAATARDKLALGALEDAGDYLGRGVAAVVNILNPPLVVIGGEIAQAAPIVFPQVALAARRWSRPRAFDGLQLVVSGLLQPGAAVVGAATMVLRHALEEGSGPAPSSSGPGSPVPRASFAAPAAAVSLRTAG